MKNYTDEQVKILKEIYDGTPESVKELAKVLGKSSRSIIGKLSKEKWYIKRAYQTKLGEDPMTKKDMVIQIAAIMNLDYEDLEGTEKTPKRALKFVFEWILEVDEILASLESVPY